jgi:hypothetical protein
MEYAMGIRLEGFLCPLIVPRKAASLIPRPHLPSKRVIFLTSMLCASQLAQSMLVKPRIDEEKKV